MLAVLEQSEEGSGGHTDNTGKYLFLMLFKLGMDAAVFHLCCQKLNTSFLNTFSVSIVFADLAMTLCMAAVWLLGAERSPVSPCFSLAHISATFGALPLPVMCLGTLDYYIEDTCTGRSAFRKHLRNVVLTLLVWILAVIHSFCSVKAELMELVYETGKEVLVCEVEESKLVNFFIFGLFTAETILTRPPLWFSLTLGFTVFWTPYLTVSVACLLFGFGVPAYIAVNLLWFECTNSLLMGVVFWVKSKLQGPYSHLPENVCLWHVFWHLSKGTWQQHLPTAVFDPSMGERNTLYYV
uniref:Uncharacterized protein n=1 Tax=Scophthalmus maximus TaxID=52904 RepID=A0A8D3AI70_SCOMX